jgi:hypothetical protein
MAAAVDTKSFFIRILLVGFACARTSLGGNVRNTGIVPSAGLTKEVTGL